jgi:hypothetical protein
MGMEYLGLLAFEESGGKRAVLVMPNFEPVNKLWARIYRMIDPNSNDCPPKGTSLIHVVSR